MNDPPIRSGQADASTKQDMRWAQIEADVLRAYYFDLYDLAPVGYFTLCEKGLFLEVNLAAATLLGLSQTLLVKESISRFILRNRTHCKKPWGCHHHQQQSPGNCF